MQKYFLIMRSEPNPGNKISLDKPQLDIGREISNDIPIIEPEVSRKHARLVQQDDSYLIEDLGSTNGTFINDVRVSIPQLLKTGDIITLGDSISMLFYEEVTQPIAAAVPSVLAPEPILESPEPKIEQEIVQPAPVESQVHSVQTPRVEEQRPLAPIREAHVPEQSVQTPAKKRFPTWLVVFLILLIVLCVIPGLILTFMPTSWWCFLSSLFNYRLAGCPL